ncbi:MAG: hypothetical protein ACREC5_06695 [Thermoplasmata archaeon]
MRPRPSLCFEGPGELLRLEATLLREEFRRYALALRLARSGREVLLDTGFLGPLTYSSGLARLDHRLARVPGEIGRRMLRALGKGALGLADLTVYLDVPPPRARLRARRAARTHPAGLRARHADVGRSEREFWLERYRAMAPGGTLVLDGRQPIRALLAELDRRVPSKGASARRVVPPRARPRVRAPTRPARRSGPRPAGP